MKLVAADISFGGEKITFRAPETGPDWVLVLDDAARGYPPPGRGTQAAN